MTASELSSLLIESGLRPEARAGALWLPAPPPAALAVAVRVLRTGLIALASGRRWWGCDGQSGRWVELDAGAAVPAGVTLLACEGAARWDRIPNASRLDCPNLFAPPAKPARSKR